MYLSGSERSIQTLSSEDTQNEWPTSPNEPNFDPSILLSNSEILNHNSQTCYESALAAGPLRQALRRVDKRT